MLALIVIAICFGVVEGITEWLPISSTGHLILLDGIFSGSGYDLSSNLGFAHGEEFLSMNEVVIQLGAILAVIVFFFNKLWPWSKKKLTEQERQFVQMGYKEDVIQMGKRRRIYSTWAKTIVGVLPAAALGLIFELLDVDKYIYSWITVAITLIVYGVAFILVEWYLGKKGQKPRYDDVDSLPMKTAFLIGCFQMLALIPGTSRSGVTIIGALLLGASRSTAAEFSFFLSIPVMIGASGLKLVSFFMEQGMPNANEWIFMGVGFLVAFAVSLFAIKWLMGFVKRHSFSAFGYYRIALGLLVIVFFATMVGLGKGIAI